MISGCCKYTPPKNANPGTIIITPWKLNGGSQILYIDNPKELLDLSAKWVFYNGIKGTQQCGYDYEFDVIDTSFAAKDFALVNMRCSTVVTNGYTYSNQLEPIQKALLVATVGKILKDTVKGGLNTWISCRLRNKNFIGYKIQSNGKEYAFHFNANDQLNRRLLTAMRSRNDYSKIQQNSKIALFKRYESMIRGPIGYRQLFDSLKIPFTTDEIGLYIDVYMR